MPLGWIDFSNSERNKVLSVLDMLSAGGVLDELGIAPVRDGFSNVFFPGTSTIQTRAKYFFLVPYALKDMELGPESNPARLQTSFHAMERKSAEALVAIRPEENGIIGKNSLAAGRWVKRTPADIYWSGLRQYGIFNGGSLSLGEYFRAMCAVKTQKSALKKLGNRNDSTEECESDDVNAGDIRGFQFWRIPTYERDWFEKISINLSAAEGKYLKEQIIASCPDTMLQVILEKRMTEILDIPSFQDLGSIIYKFPEHIQRDYQTALAFSDFIFAVRAVYNMIISDGMNNTAEEIVHTLEKDFNAISGIDVDAILTRLSIYNNPTLRTFLKNAQEYMEKDDLEGLKKCIKNRETALKGQSRAKTCHPGQYDNAWLGGGELDYRFGNAKAIIRDIFESEFSPC